MFQRFLEWVKKMLNKVGKTEIKKTFGADVCISSEMQRAIELWRQMYEDAPPWLGAGVRSMGLAAAIASEVARLVTVEMQSEITGSARAEYLNSQYAPVLDSIRQYTEYGCAKGGLILKPYVSGDKIVVDYVQADSFFPTAFDTSGRVTGAVFADQIKRGGRIYTRLEYHSLSGRNYRICNAAYVSDSDSYIGSPVSLQAVDEWAELEEDTTIQNVDQPLFAYFKVPSANTVDVRSPLGASVYSRAVDLIREADKQYSRLLWEFESGERALYVSDTAFQKGKDNKPILPNKRLYRALAVEDAKGDLFKDWTPTLREENILRGLNAILRKIEFNCGLAYGTLSDVQDTDKTAEEILASKQRSYTTVCDIQRALEAALNDLIYAMDVLCTLYKLAPAGRYDTSFAFDDSIIADRKTEFAERQQLVSLGILQPWEFRMWYLGESEEEAKRAAGAIGTDPGAENGFRLDNA